MTRAWTASSTTLTRCVPPSAFLQVNQHKHAADPSHLTATPIPQPQKYEILKQGTPFYIYGRARDGSVVAYQLSGRICPRHLSTNGVKQVRSWSCVCKSVLLNYYFSVTHDG